MCASWKAGGSAEREFFINNLLVRIHIIVVMIRWTGLAPWEFEFPFPGSHTSTFLLAVKNVPLFAGSDHDRELAPPHVSLAAVLAVDRLRVGWLNGFSFITSTVA